MSLPQTQQSRVLLQLRDLILKGAFAPRERLAEIPLAERLHASRTPVRLALAALEHEGLIETSPSGGYQMRGFTAEEVDHAIQSRGVLEGYAARLLAEEGVSRQLSRELHECLEQGDAAVYKSEMTLDDYALYVDMNDRLHKLIVHGCGNSSVIRLIEMLSGQPFAAPSAMLPMQSSMSEGQQWMQVAHRTHHSLVHAIENRQGLRAQMLGEEHVQIARMNLENALRQPEVSAEVIPGIKLLTPKP